MTPAIKRLTLVLMLTLLLSGQAAPRAAALQVLRPNSQAVLPPDCATRTVVRPLIIPSWVFVMNFEVIQGGNPLGCLIVFRSPRTPTHTISVACNVFGAGVVFGGGQALF